MNRDGETVIGREGRARRSSSKHRSITRSDVRRSAEPRSNVKGRREDKGSPRNKRYTLLVYTVYSHMVHRGAVRVIHERYDTVEANTYELTRVYYRERKILSPIERRTRKKARQATIRTREKKWVGGSIIEPSVHSAPLAGDDDCYSGHTIRG